MNSLPKRDEEKNNEDDYDTDGRCDAVDGCSDGRYESSGNGQHDAYAYEQNQDSQGEEDLEQETRGN